MAEIFRTAYKRHAIFHGTTISHSSHSAIIPRACLMAFGYAPQGSGGMSYCNQTPFPPREGWGLGTRLGLVLSINGGITLPNFFFFFVFCRLQCRNCHLQERQLYCMGRWWPGQNCKSCLPLVNIGILVETITCNKKK